MAKVEDAAKLLDDVLKELKACLPTAELRNNLEQNETILKGVIATLVLLVILNLYLQRRLSRLSSEHRRSTIFPARWFCWA